MFSVQAKSFVGRHLSRYIGQAQTFPVDLHISHPASFGSSYAPVVMWLFNDFLYEYN